MSKKAAALIAGLTLFLATTSTIVYAQNDQATDRTNDRSQRVPLEIDSVRADTISRRCVASQKKITTALTRAQEAKNKRLSLYDNFSKKSDAIIARFNDQSIDTTQLVLQVTALNSMINEVKANIDLYVQALSDASTIDCESDVRAFMLALEDARQLRKNLASSSGKIVSYFRSTIAPTLNELKAKLPKTGEEEGE